jgi:type II secretory pathway pseudopilin PulG
MKTAQPGKQKAESRKQKWDCGARNPVSRNTQHATPVLRSSTAEGGRNTPRSSWAFTLIELLVVIGVIVILAGLSFPIMGAVKRAQNIKRAQTELTQLETFIELYQQKLGFYPPDNPGYWSTNQLYFELMGTTNIPTPSPGVFQTLDGSARIANTPTAFKLAFGNNTTVVRFMNCALPGQGNDEAASARSFVKGLKSTQFMAVTTPVTSTVLGLGIDGPGMFSAGGPAITPWCYNSSSPRYNSKSFDLWVDITLAGKTNRICNWSDKALIISTPY